MNKTYEDVYYTWCMTCKYYRPKTRSNCEIYKQLINSERGTYHEYLKRYITPDHTCKMYTHN